MLIGTSTILAQCSYANIYGTIATVVAHLFLSLSRSQARLTYWTRPGPWLASCCSALDTNVAHAWLPYDRYSYLPPLWNQAFIAYIHAHALKSNVHYAGANYNGTHTNCIASYRKLKHCMAPAVRATTSYIRSYNNIAIPIAIPLYIIVSHMHLSRFGNTNKDF